MFGKLKKVDQEAFFSLSLKLWAGGGGGGGGGADKRVTGRAGRGV